MSASDQGHVANALKGVLEKLSAAAQRSGRGTQVIDQLFCTLHEGLLYCGECYLKGE